MGRKEIFLASRKNPPTKRSLDGPCDYSTNGPFRRIVTFRATLWWIVWMRASRTLRRPSRGVCEWELGQCRMAFRIHAANSSGRANSPSGSSGTKIPPDWHCQPSKPGIEFFFCSLMGNNNSGIVTLLGNQHLSTPRRSVNVPEWIFRDCGWVLLHILFQNGPPRSRCCIVFIFFYYSWYDFVTRLVHSCLVLAQSGWPRVNKPVFLHLFIPLLT